MGQGSGRKPGATDAERVAEWVDEAGVNVAKESDIDANTEADSRDLRAGQPRYLRLPAHSGTAWLIAARCRPS